MSSVDRAPTPTRGRFRSLDALRGLIIVLMTVDHANYFIAGQHPAGEHWGGPFPAYADALPFIARLITHPVAPGFFFLLGAGMVLFAQARGRAGWSKWQITRTFLLRGGLLIALQLLLVNRAWEMRPGGFPQIYLGVLYALGGCMILGSWLVNLGPRWSLALSAVLFVGVELTHPAPELWGQIFDQPLGLLFGYSGGSGSFWSNYPILPWLEVVFLGMAFGHWFVDDSERAARRAGLLGVAFLAGFVVLRAADGFGNIRPSAGDGWIDFLNVVKYPPSLTFTLLMVGVDLILLWVLGRLQGAAPALLRPLTILGGAPLFCYVVHLFLYAGIARWWSGGDVGLMPAIPYWLLGLLLLLPAANWFGRFKRSQPITSPLRLL